ncbi:MAG: hypothetical protein EAZ35_02205 [Sphingobacteriia bacterium]|nr:MAG: hypothetical protein EAZ35_02205 [Sphingobacteriia bacterium]
MEDKLPNGITQEMIDAAKEKHTKVKMATLFDEDGNELKAVLVGTPSAQVLNNFERFLDNAPAKAKKILLKGVLCSSEEIAELPQNSELFIAAFNGCIEMIPVGKAVLKNV